MSGHRHLLREGSASRGKVTNLELFFDLVFVFAITQLSHTLLAQHDAIGVVRTVLLFFAVWWLWIYTSWFTNWLDPDKPPVRIAVILLMLGGLTLSTALPHAFGERGLVFGAAFAVMQVGRSIFMMRALKRGGRSANHRNFQRITMWLSTSGVCWVAGGLVDGDARFFLWLVGMGIEYAGPMAYFWVPGLGRSHTEDWDIDGGHMAERCGLFIIVALGESILVTGATFATQPWTATNITSFLIAFVGSVAMWWIYFDTGAARATHRIEHAADPGRIGRLVYTYLHMFTVAGIIACAVSDEILLAHATHLTWGSVAAMVGGPFLYIGGNAVCKYVSNDRVIPPLSHLVGMALLVILFPLAGKHLLSVQALAAAATGVLVLVAVWEAIAIRRRPRQGARHEEHAAY